MKPILLLDIDGTINADCNDMWPEWVETRAHSLDGLPWKIMAAVPVLNFFKKLHQLDVADIRWHSTWQAASLNVGDALGLPPFGVQDALPNGAIHRGAAWKLEAVEFLWAQGETVIWVDDEANDLLDRSSEPDWVVCPRRDTGLDADDLLRIARLLRVERELT